MSLYLKRKKSLRHLTQCLRLIAIFVLLLSACSNNSQNDTSIKVNQEINKDLVGQKFIFDSSILVLSEQKIDFNSDNKKIVVLGEADCGKCIEQLDRWNNFKFNDDLKNFKVVFFFVGSRSVVIDEYISKNNLKNKFIICLDTASNLLKDMKFYKYTKKTLILDNKNEVIYVGDPTEDENVLADLKILGK